MKSFDNEVSGLLDYALWQSEQGSGLWAWIKSVIERWILE